MKNSDSPITSDSWILGFKNFKFEREISAFFFADFFQVIPIIAAQVQKTHLDV